jgi:hypothetical protein
VHDRDVAHEHGRHRGLQRRRRQPRRRRPHARHRVDVPRPHREGRRPIVVSGSIPKRHIDVDDFDALIAATPFTVKVKWQSTVSIAATSYKYTLWLECPNAQYVAGQPNPLMNQRRHGATFDWKATYAGSAGSSKWTLVNATTSYA